jgi:hypothetical protein
MCDAAFSDDKMVLPQALSWQGFSAINELGVRNASSWIQKL